MSIFFRKLFIEHPESEGENYFTHSYQASIFGIKLIIYGIAELIHAVIPGIDLFEIFGTKSHIQLNKLTNKLKLRKEGSKID